MKSSEAVTLFFSVSLFFLLLGIALYYFWRLSVKHFRRNPKLKKLDRKITATDGVVIFIVLVIGLYAFILSKPPTPPVKYSIDAVETAGAPATVTNQRISNPPASHVYHDGLPIETVQHSYCLQGGTVDQYFTEKTANSAVVDLGWSMRDTEDGFIVAKEIQIQGLSSSTIYLWKVNSGGHVTPLNGHAISLSPR